MYREYTLYAQLLLQFQADPFETLQALLGWSEDMHIVFFFFRILKLFCIAFYCIFNLDFVCVCVCVCVLFLFCFLVLK